MADTSHDTMLGQRFLEMETKFMKLLIAALALSAGFSAHAMDPSSLELPTSLKASSRRLEAIADTSQDKTRDKIDKKELARELIDLVNKSAENLNIVDVKECIERCVEVGIGLDQKDDNAMTALSWAVRNGHMAVVECLIASGANVNATSNKGFTALMWAAFKGRKAVVEFLIKSGANVHAAANDGFNTLMAAAQFGHIDEVKCLLAHGANVHAAVDDGRTALMWAAKNGHKGVVECLLNCKANVNVEAKSGFTALMGAAGKGHKDIVECLIKSGANVNATNNKDRTVLMVAANYDKQPCCEILVDAMLQPFEHMKKCAVTFLCCLKRKNFGGQYTHLKQIFKPYLCQMIDEKKEPVRTEINKITKDEIKQDLLTKYFPEKDKII